MESNDWWLGRALKSHMINSANESDWHLVVWGKDMQPIAYCGIADNAESEKIGRLIAAAPELLEALKVAQKWIEFAKEHCQLGVVAGGDWYIDQDNIRKAIAKAEGK